MRRGHWWMAGMWAGLASGTRQAGVLLAVGFVIEYMRQRDWKLSRIRWDAAAIAIVPTGLIGYMIFCWSFHGDPLKFMHIQSFWGRSLSLPWTGTVNTIKQLGDQMGGGAIFQPGAVLNVIDLISVPVTIALLVLSMVGPWRLGRESWYLIASATAAFIMVLVSPLGPTFPPLHGVPRYVLETIPAFMVAARIGANQYAERFYLFPAIGVQAALLIAWFFQVWLS